MGERKRRISGQISGRMVTRESQRAVWLDDTEIRLEVRRENGVITSYSIHYTKLYERDKSSARSNANGAQARPAPRACQACRNQSRGCGTMRI